MRYMLEDEFGDIIGKARAGQGIPPAKLAQQAGIALDRLEGLEACQAQPAAAELQALARELSLDPAKLQDLAAGRYQPAASSAAQVVEITGYIGNYPVHGYLLACLQTKRAAAVDTANDPQAMLQAAREHDWQIDTFLATHNHVDHVGGLAALQAATGARIAIHEQDRPALDQLWDAQRDVALGDDQELRVGELVVRCRHTPGHTAGSTTYLSEGVVFVGDTLFAGSVGRANFSYTDLLRSIRERILTLPEATVIFPGHGPVATVGEEKRHNPFF